MYNGKSKRNYLWACNVWQNLPSKRGVNIRLNLRLASCVQVCLNYKYHQSTSHQYFMTSHKKNSVQTRYFSISDNWAGDKVSSSDDPPS